ncbi:MAG: sigma-70 family RNA polymerase sigma factor [Bacteroidota bacterium]
MVYRKIVLQTCSKVLRKCVSIVQDREVAKDLSQDVMIKVFANLSKFKGKSDFSFWVKSITYNHCMDYLKQQKRLQFSEVKAEEFERISIDEIEQEHSILKEIKLSQLERFLEELKGNDRLILLMRYQEGMSVKQITDSLKISSSAVKMRLKRSRDRLAALIKNAADEE